MLTILLTIKFKSVHCNKKILLSIVKVLRLILEWRSLVKQWQNDLGNDITTNLITG